VDASRERTAIIHDSLPLWVTALQELAAASGIRVVGSAPDEAQALDLVSRMRPTLFITEIDGPDGTIRLDIVRRARGIDADLKVIVLSTSSEPAAVGAAFAAGADVYVLKNADPNDLSAAMRQVFNQSFFVAASWAALPEAVESSPKDAPVLTRRELEILQLVAEGHTNGAMASMLWVTEQTIKFHLSNIYRKLDVSNRTEAGRWAQLHGLLSTTKPEQTWPARSMTEAVR